MLIQVFFHKIQQFYQVDPKIKQLSSVSFNENRLILANGSTSIKFWIYEDKTNKSKINIPRPFGQLLSTMMNYFSKWEKNADSDRAWKCTLTYWHEDHVNSVVFNKKWNHQSKWN